MDLGGLIFNQLNEPRSGSVELHLPIQIITHDQSTKSVHVHIIIIVSL